MNRIEQHIESINFLNVNRLDLLNHIKEDIKQLEGKKLELASGGLSKQFKLKGEHKKTTIDVEGKTVYLSYQYYYSIDYGYLKVHHKVCINGGSYEDTPSTAFCQYQTSTDYIGRIQKQHLTEVLIDKVIKDTTTEVLNPLNDKEFNKQKEEYTKLKQQLQQTRNKIHPYLREFL